MHIPFKRIIAFGAAVLMVFTMTACNKGNKSSTTGTDSGSTKSGLPSIKIQDLGGYTFKVMDFSDGRWNKTKSGTPYLDAWQKLINNVETKLNCKIEAMTPVAPGDIIQQAQPAIASGDKYADLICTTQWAYGYFLGAGLMMDLNKLKVNWDAPWWNQNIREMSTTQGKTYAANGSFIFDAAQTWMLYYNQDIWDELQLPDPYKLVNSGEWTFDKFAEYAKKAVMDKDGSGLIDSKDDRWGVVAPDGDFARALFLAGGNHYFKEENGKMRLAANNTKTYDYVAKMRKMVALDHSICNVKFTKTADHVDMFTKGKALFLSYMPGVTGLTDMESDWGVMPLPKADASQKKYMSGVDHNAVVCGVTNTNTDIDKDSLIMDALGYYGMALEDIYWPDYKETYWRHEDVDAAVIKNHVAHHGQYDLALLMQNVKPQFSQPMGIVFGSMYGGTTDVSSLFEQVQDQINSTLDAYFTGTTLPPTETTAAAE